MFDIFLDALGVLIEVLKRNPQVRRAIIAISVLALVVASSIGISSELFEWPLPNKQVAPVLAGIAATAVFMLFIALAAYVGLKVKGGGVLQLELESLHEERKRITERLAETPKPDILDTIQLSLNQLNEYYSINKSQARNSFTFSVFAIVIGLATLVGGIWIFYFRDSPRVDLAAITSIAGVLTQFIGGAYFYLYRRSQEQLNFFFEQLVKMQDTMLSVKLCEQVSPPERQVELREKIVLTLLNRSSVALIPLSGEKGG